MSCDKEYDDANAPEWATTGTEDALSAHDDTSWIAMRMSSHFLSSVQPELERFVENYREEYRSLRQKDAEEKSGEYNLQQFKIYNMYCGIFEKRMSSFTSEYKMNDIVQCLNSAVAASAGGKESMGTILLSMLEALSSFQDFDVMMMEDSLLCATYDQNEEKLAKDSFCK